MPYDPTFRRRYPSQLPVSLDDDLKDFINAEAARRGVSKSQIARDLMELGRDEYEKSQSIAVTR